MNKKILLTTILAVVVCFVVFYFHTQKSSVKKPNVKEGRVKAADKFVPPPQVDFAAYNAKLNLIANNPIVASSTATSTKPALWPVKTTYPNGGALLPFNRIVAYYGNLYSRGMGVLGEYPEDEMLDRLNTEVKKWQAADPQTPVIPALHYIAVVAQAGGGRDGKFRARMPDKEIDKVLKMAQKINPAPCPLSENDPKIPSSTLLSSPKSNYSSCGAGGIVFLDIQVGLSNVQTEVPLLEKYLKLPNVHLGIDPEFSMKNGFPPGTAIGTLDAADINFAAGYLAKIVRDNNLPPKVLVIHRFTQKMVTNYKKITPLPEVEIVMDMDGFGGAQNKLNTYYQSVYKEPVQFTGFKLFYKNDVQAGGMLTPNDLLKLTPIPVYIQYQ